ncbi:hypothetical protein B4079_1856 [Bacillus cereus]|nr:hypothetical protein B4079_1856 [Bacillus cereus]
MELYKIYILTKIRKGKIKVVSYFSFWSRPSLMDFGKVKLVLQKIKN